jgi:hypothetical protein
VQSSQVRHRILLALFALLAAAACKREPEPPAGVISRDRFVAANVALRSLPDSAPQTRRDAALRKARVTDKELRAWVIAYSRQPETLSKAWEEIAFKVDSIGGERPVPPMVGGPPPPPAVVGAPGPMPGRDSIVTSLPIPDSALARRRRRRIAPPPPRPGVAAEPVRVQ